MIIGNLHKNMGIDNARIKSEPKQVAPPFFCSPRGLLILAHLVAATDSPHVLVVKGNSGDGWNFDVCSILLLSSNCLIAFNFTLCANKRDNLLVFPYRCKCSLSIDKLIPHYEVLSQLVCLVSNQLENLFCSNI